MCWPSNARLWCGFNCRWQPYGDIMSGTLIVQNLQGPASGANANKIIVPAGQVLDASAGTFTPSVDQIVQVKTYYLVQQSGYRYFSSASWTATGDQLTITPVYVGSKIVFDVHYSMIDNPSGYTYLQLRLNGSLPSGVGIYHLGYMHGTTKRYAPFGGSHVMITTNTSAILAEPYIFTGAGTCNIHEASSVIIKATEIAQ